ncbi:MAG: efflux RND transporter permease subunit [Patescibacteria group bacterium]|nr:efflux RND transporter permease subunit [Patescibacteria group bacterium]
MTKLPFVRKKNSKINRSPQEKLNYLQKLSLFFFKRKRTTALIWLVVLAFGIASYATLLKREGFPTIESPFAIAQGSYLVNDSAKVDSDVAKPLSDFLLKQEGVKTVQTQSFDNFYTATVSYKDNVQAEPRSQEIQKALDKDTILPANATGKIEAFKFGWTQRGDNMVVSFYAKNNTVTQEELNKQAQKAAKFIESQHLPLVRSASAINPFEVAVNPMTGEKQSTQKSFESFGERQDGSSKFYTAAVIGIGAYDKADNLELDKQVQGAVDKLNASSEFSGYKATISGSYAPDIKFQVSELQQTLLEGLLAVLVVASILIAVRASLIIIIAMVSVIAIVNALLYVIGYSLNTITLFSLVLGLSLIVDDTIIMTEAIDAQRRRHTDATEAISVATRKIGRAMVAATLTAALSFAPFLFVGGILGKFIRAIPVTIISALLISLFVALVFIPLFARFLLLGKKQMGKKESHNLASGFEAKIARFISAPMLWAKNSKKKLTFVGIIAIIVGFGFIGAGGALFQKVTFNIFPPDKDSNVLNLVLTYPANTSVSTAEATATSANQIMAKELGDNFEKAANYNFANTQSSTLTVYLKDYKQRKVTAPQLVDKLSAKFANFKGAKVAVNTSGAGGPPGVFSIHVDARERDNALKLANDIQQYLETTKLKRIDGTTVKVSSVAVDNTSIRTRKNSKAYIGVGIKFKDTDTSALFTLTQDKVKKAFPPSRVASYGLDKNALSFDLGQESENQDSFKTLALAFPVLLLLMYLLLASQFRSLLQPLLIFMALPFSLFGITLGLYLTDNAFSFFSMLGFFALIGLSIKNTILLTDSANQARQSGMHAVDAAHEALAERFRPLVATSFTAIVSLIPLAITSPFWEGLCVVLICGLLSSTFLVITVFPYYYLGTEYLRTRINRRTGISWLVLSIAATIMLIKVGAGPAAVIAPVIAALLIYFGRRKLRHRK